jgi:MoaA/NifB/PqqE/SkfB family radical SAM enzyme
MNGERWSNVVAARDQYEAGGERAGDGPIEAFFEVAARCNLRCQMCAINYDSRYQPRSGRPPFFEPDLFARLRPIFPSLVRAYLFGLGEPTLNKHLVDYIGELASAGVEVWFNTNATLIDEQLAGAMACAGASKITVSIDGATAPTYETIRRGAKFDAVIRGIRALVAAKLEVNLSFVGMASNIRELPAMIELCAELGATGVHVEPLYAQPASDDLIEHYRHENLGVAAADVSALFDEASQRAKDLGVSLATRFAAVRNEFDYVRHARHERPDWTCSEPWSSIWVTSAGEVRTCCTNETSFGNLFERSIDDIWNGAEFRAFRTQHARREIATGCGNCVSNGRVRQSPFFRAIEAVTYRPLVFATANDEAVRIDLPRAGTTVTDPLIITGCIDGRAEDFELMIDATPVANFNDAGCFAADEFVIELPIGYVSEGAHVVWVRHRGATSGWGHRQVFLWRPGDGVTTHALYVLSRDAAPLPPALFIGEHRWPRVAWKTMYSTRGLKMVGLADLASLPPGDYAAEVRLLGRVVETGRLERLHEDGKLMRAVGAEADV